MDDVADTRARTCEDTVASYAAQMREFIMKIGCGLRQFSELFGSIVSSEVQAQDVRLLAFVVGDARLDILHAPSLSAKWQTDLASGDPMTCAMLLTSSSRARSAPSLPA